MANVSNENRKNAISVNNIIKTFGNGKERVEALKGINLDIKKGELFGLLGPNGAGKTTLIKILATLLDQTSGEALVENHSLSEEKAIRKIIGVCPQEPAYYSFLSGKENIELFGKLHNVPKDILKSRTEKILEDFQMADFADRKAGKYSGGMIRKINMAISLVNDPSIFFLDEPTVAMDPQSRRAVWDVINDLKNKGKTIILTTHYIEEAEQLSDRVGIIDKGELIELGSPGELLKKHEAENLEDVFIKITGRKIKEEI